jgi:hypothetical protein
MSSQTVNIRLSFDILLEDRGDHWAALIEQIGTRVYGDDEQAASRRAGEMIQFMVSSFSEHATLDNFRKYLDNHGVQHSIEVIGSESTRPARPRRYRREDAFAFTG